tara:strand:- start:1345 stop:1983 length:639 start_codon:yes stop_codon:yes gene_type:complete
MSDTDKIAPAFVKACADLRGAEINAVNSHLKSGYSDLSSVQAAARAALIPHGLAWYQQVVQQDGMVGVRTVIIHTSGQQIDMGVCLFPIAPGRNLLHQFGASLTYSRRYSLSAALGISQEDPDGSLPQQQPKKAQGYPPPKKAAPKKAAPKAEKPTKAVTDELEKIKVTEAQVDAWLASKGKGDTWATLTPARRKKALEWLKDNAAEVRGEK